ncbi:copper amine oxidase N-terminal domain-containing protein [Paenibacillus montanisoli]|nr:copper amine oxidase N-terminal domain-containing protein [Paenibacillus montanisoli]
MTKIRVTFLSICTLFLLCSTVNAERRIMLNVQNRVVEDAQLQPMMIDGTMFIPVRTFALLPDTQIIWNESSKTVTITHIKTNNQLTVVPRKGANTVNNYAQIINGRVYVLLRDTATKLHVGVDWNQRTGTVYVYRAEYMRKS